MRKRVAMAQNWIIDREILLMDEPFSALDIHTRQRMEGELLALWEQSGGEAASGFSRTSRKTVIFVTHDLEEAIALADEVVVLSAGPASRVVSQHPVTLDRPRDLLDLRTQPAFVDLYRSIWAGLRQEVIKSQRGAEAVRG
jgi:NitT/TauT family transport system ATP-binding protein